MFYFPILNLVMQHYASHQLASGKLIFIPSAFLIALSVTSLVKDGPGAETSLIIPTG